LILIVDQAHPSHPGLPQHSAVGSKVPHQAVEEGIVCQAGIIAQVILMAAVAITIIINIGVSKQLGSTVQEVEQVHLLPLPRQRQGRAQRSQVGEFAFVQIVKSGEDGDELHEKVDDVEGDANNDDSLGYPEVQLS
jgi:hypothetical protein